ncbi:MAG: hypothetical protein D6816_02170 [Bacteroidetes bacterium]|nr:MAG: hypothetical protein D6816_02170 [Bacteroidota bacterium]
MAVILLGGCAGQSPEPLAKYSRSGGIANLDDSLVVYQDGRTVITRRGKACELTLSESELQQLETALAAANLNALDGQYRPNGPGADLMTYAVTYDGRTVSAADTAVPDSLWPVLELFNQTAGKCN